MEFKIGDRVTHVNFGNGTIVQVDNADNTFPYYVRFDKEHDLLELEAWYPGENDDVLESNDGKRYLWFPESPLEKIDGGADDGEEVH